MTIEEKNRIRAHLDELCEWVDEQSYSQEEQEAAAETIEALENEVRDVREQRDEAFRRLDEMEAKVAILVDYLQTIQRYHRSAAQYYMEEGKTTEEDKHGEAFVECVSCEVMLRRLFEDNDMAYVKGRTDMHDKLATSYESRFGLN